MSDEINVFIEDVNFYAEQLNDFQDSGIFENVIQYDGNQNNLPDWMDAGAAILSTDFDGNGKPLIIDAIDKTSEIISDFSAAASETFEDIKNYFSFDEKFSIGSNNDILDNFQDYDVNINNNILNNVEMFVENSSLDDSWHLQEAPNSCAVAVQTDILNDLGINVSEEQMRNYAEIENIYTETEGTPLDNIGDILENNNVPLMEQRDNFSITDLIEAKIRGEKIIIGLDAAEYRGTQNILQTAYENITGNSTPLEGHAVEFKNIFQDADGNYKVVLDDPGEPGGHNKIIGLEEFSNSWADYNNFAVITNINTIV